MNLRKFLKKQFFPNQENDYQPYFLRGKSIIRLAFVIAVIFLGYAFQTVVVRDTDYFAAVIPRVLVDLANSSRNEHGISPLMINPVLENAARMKAEDMAMKGYFAHVSPDGATPWQWFAKAEYPFVYAGENLAINFSESDAVNTAWLNSPAHKANILNGKFTEIGIAVARGNYQGRETVFVVQMFGTPRARVITAAKQELIYANVPLQKPAQTIAQQPPKPKIEEVAAAMAETSVVPLYSDNAFVAVKNRNADDNIVITQQDERAFSSYASVFEKIFYSPQKNILVLYAILGAIILLAIGMHILIEIRRQYPRYIGYGILLIVCMIALAYLGTATFIPQVAVI